MLRRSAQCTPGDSGAGALPINPEAMSHTMRRLFYSTGQVARQLGATPAAIRLLCENRLIAAETSPGGQWRVPARRSSASNATGCRRLAAFAQPQRSCKEQDVQPPQLTTAGQLALQKR